MNNMSESQLDRALVSQCLNDGADGVRDMVGEVVTLAEQFRGGAVTASNQGLARLAQDLGALIVLVQTLRQPVAEIGAAGTLPSEHDVESLASLLEALVAAQVTQDWLTVADVLEYDVEPALQAWLAQLDGVRTTLAA
jgi:hypothetical protein